MANVSKEDESYLDALLDSAAAGLPEETETPQSQEKTQKEDAWDLPELAFTDTELPDLEHYSIFDEFDEKELDAWLDQDSRSAEAAALQKEQESPLLPAPEKEEPEENEIPALFSGIPDAAPAGSAESEIPAALFSGIPDAAPADSAENEIPAALFDGILSAPPEKQEGDEIPDMLSAESKQAEEETAEIDDMEKLLSGLSGMSFGAEDPEEEEQAGGSDIFSLESLLSGIGEEISEADLPEAQIPEAEEPSELLAAGKEAEAGALEEPKEKKGKRAKKRKERKKNGVFSKLFGNVPIDPSKIKKEPTKEEIEAKKKEKAAKKEKEKEEKKAEADQKKAEAQKQKEEKARLAKAAKEEKKAKKLEEAKLVLEELNTTRINRAGASIVFIFFAVIAVVIIIGSNILSYSIAIRNAGTEFGRRHYNNAYEEVCGLEVKPQDQLLYDQIITVMYVQKQLNSYNNFMKIGDKAKALDSLLKGLQRYGKYMDLAEELGIMADFDYVRGQLLAEINRNFYLSADEADALVALLPSGIGNGSQLEYSVAVYDVVYGDER